MNKLTAEKCREQFEDWGKSQRCELDKWVRGDRAGEYKNPVVAKMWQAWEASRAALPILEQQERGEGWIEWGGGAMPTSTPFQEVGYLTRLGNKDKSSAGDLRWAHEGKGGDIIAYRIIPDRAINQNGDDV